MRALLFAFCMALMISVSARAIAQEVAPLPEPVSAELPNLKTRGTALLRMLGFRIYNGTLWTTDGQKSLDQPFVLDLQYLRNFEGKALSERSIDEMKGQDVGTPEQHAKWLTEMLRVFPNVKPNDRITGVSLPGKGAKFFHNGKLTGEVNDPAFAKAFFDIWLSPKTSQPSMRKELLKE
jgi:hypothetical protein